MRIINKPIPEEYLEYSGIYMNLLEDDGKVLNHLWNNFIEIKKLIYELLEDKLLFRHDKGKWTIKEILVHLIDDEQIFAYRALRYARNDQTPLPGDQGKYAYYSQANSRTLDSIFDEYKSIRKSTISLFQNLPDDSFMRIGSGIDIDGSSVNKRMVRS